MQIGLTSTSDDDNAVTRQWAPSIEMNTRCTWAGGTYVNYSDFCKNHHFHVFYYVNHAHVLFPKNFCFTIHVELAKSVGLVPSIFC